MKPLVFTIHGIYTDGEWQRGARVVLAPFFDYNDENEIHYGQYRRWAILKLSADLILILLTLFVVVLFLWIRLLPTPLAGLTAGAFLMSALVLLRMWMSRKMSGLVEQIEANLTAIIQGRRTPSVIAHSLGTLLISRLMLSFDSRSFDKIIFDGCVVDREFPWDTMVSRFTHIFNEIGGKDTVPRFAALLKYSIQGIGSAGAKGFVGSVVTPGMLNPSEVLVLGYQDEVCCPEHGVGAEKFVHNILFPEIKHSGYHCGLTHARDFWLPRLLGFDPVLYRRFYEECARVEEMRGHPEDFKRALRLLGSKCFGWTRGSLRIHVREQLARVTTDLDAAPVLEALADLALASVCEITTEMMRSLSAEPPSPDDKIWEFLDPRSAIRNSVAALVEDLIERGFLEEVAPE